MVLEIVGAHCAFNFILPLGQGCGQHVDTRSARVLDLALDRGRRAVHHASGIKHIGLDNCVAVNACTRTQTEA